MQLILPGAAEGMMMTVWRNSMLLALAVCGLMASSTAATSVTLHEATVSQLQQAMVERRLSAVQLLDYYLAQIGAHDQNGAELKALISVQDPDVLRQLAQQLDDQRTAGKVRGPLHGIPVVLKDNIDTADGLATTAGSWLLRDHHAADDAFIVSRLRDAGAIILGKANLSEWANFRSSYSSSGWSSLGGQTKNPYDTSRSPCGSSSGSAVAVSANFTALAVGTETDGSLVCPASINGIVSIKPTLGLISRDGIIPIAHSQDTAGPMARTVTDAVILLQAMSHYDERDGASYASAVELTDHLRLDGLKGKRIGVMRDLTGYHPEVDRVFNQQLELLRQAGAEIVDELSFANGRNWNQAEFTVLLHEFKSDIASYLQDSAVADFRSLADLIAANRAYASQTMPWFGQDLFELAEARQADQQDAYEQALNQAKQAAGQDGIDAVLTQHKLDLLIAPTGGPAWKIDLITGDHFLGSASGAAAVAGYPHITVPMGQVGHLPVGISFFASAQDEPILIEAAFAFEQLSKQRFAPVLLPSSN
jgi:amidase/aspartyl-tRNA(Asn)/glutamyl-tRNA(Gln) amidotransferase subunit A